MSARRASPSAAHASWSTYAPSSRRPWPPDVRKSRQGGAFSNRWRGKMIGPAARKRVVILGSGFGGMAAAKALRGADADVTLGDRTNHHLFRPLLYQLATAA